MGQLCVCNNNPGINSEKNVHISYFLTSIFFSLVTIQKLTTTL